LEEADFLLELLNNNVLLLHLKVCVFQLEISTMKHCRELFGMLSLERNFLLSFFLSLLNQQDFSFSFLSGFLFHLNQCVQTLYLFPWLDILALILNLIFFY